MAKQNLQKCRTCGQELQDQRKKAERKPSSALALREIQRGRGHRGTNSPSSGHGEAEDDYGPFLCVTFHQRC